MDIRNGYRRVAMLATVLALIALAGCRNDSGVAPRAGAASAAPSESAPRSEATPPEPTSAAPTSPAAVAGGPTLRPELVDFVRKQPGTLSVQVRDRVTGATWQAGNVGVATWTASTIK